QNLEISGEKEGKNERMDSAEKGLLVLVGEEEEDEQVNMREGFFQEMRRLGYIAGPMVAVNSSMYFLQVISIMMVGHLGELFLSSTAIAVSFCSVTGFSLVFGLATALETLCGQANGAKQFEKLGEHTYTGIFALFIVSIPLSILWSYMGEILCFIGQDPLVSQEAGKFATWLIPALFAYATLQPLVRFFQAQSLILPLIMSSISALCCHVVLCWCLVFKFGLGSLGAALAISVSYWLNVIVLGLYMVFSSSCEKSRAKISMNVFKGMREFFRFGIPSASMICLEWWSFEFLVMLSGILPNPRLETSVLSVCLSTISTLYQIPESLGAAARFFLESFLSIFRRKKLTLSLYISSCCCSTRVANELGAGNSKKARMAVYTVMVIAGVESILVGALVFAARNVFGYLFSSEPEVVDYVRSMAPLVALSVIFDALHAVLSGVARGSGRQDVGAYVNLAAYYLFGIPTAVLLGFRFKMRGRGLWIGITVGSFVQALLLGLIVSLTNWKQQRDELNQILSSYLNTINDTLQLFEHSPPQTQDKLNWDDVLNMSDHLSRQATIVGMLWTGEPPEAEALKETMESYYNTLQGFLLLCHGSMVGAGPTLSSSIQASVKQIVDSSFKLLHGSVSLYGAVWEACSNLKKIPTTNIKAIGRAMTQVAVSVKDVLREMQELKPASACSSPEHDVSVNSDEDDDDLGDDLSPEELEVAALVADVVSDTLIVVKELIRAIASMIKMENPEDKGEFVDSFEKLLKLCQGTGEQIDELGACVYPPQELSLIKQILERINGYIGEVEADVKGFMNSSSSEAFLGTCRRLQSLIEHMVSELDTRTEAEVVCNMHNVTL
ncbi:unnamed protein product, partial [Brassica rapa]